MEDMSPTRDGTWQGAYCCRPIYPRFASQKPRGNKNKSKKQPGKPGSRKSGLSSGAPPPPSAPG